jgi:hypothetical protein
MLIAQPRLTASASMENIVTPGNALYASPIQITTTKSLSAIASPETEK